MVIGGVELRAGKSRVNIKVLLNVYLTKLTELYARNLSILKYIEYLNFYYSPKLKISIDL